MKTLILTLFFLSLTQLCIGQQTNDKKGYELAEVYTGLRGQILTLDKEQITPQGDILGLVMETGYPEAVMTLVAVADGSTSIYFSNGGGVIGAGEYPQVREVVLEVLKESNAYRSYLTKSDNASLPSPAYTTFHLVTTSGIFSGQALEDTLGNDQHALSPLFHSCHKLIAYIRAAEEHRESNN